MAKRARRTTKTARAKKTAKRAAKKTAKTAPPKTKRTATKRAAARKAATKRTATKRAAKKTAKTAKTAARKTAKTTAAQSQGRASGFALKDGLVEEALVSGERRDLLEAYFGEELYEELRTLTTRARTARVRGGPRVLVLPGIMGSKLGRDRTFFDDVIWVDPIDIVAGNLEDLSLIDGHPDIEPLGVILLAYLKIKLRLNLAGFDADFHPFDWRRDIAVLGKQLADRIVRETSSGSGNGALTLVAHSMGGLVSRAAVKHLEGRGEADRVSRLIMLGTPNYGSFSPVQAMSGHHSLVKKVAAIDLKNDEADLVNDVFNSFPGLHQMLPARQRYSGLDLYDPANWPPKGFGPRPDLLTKAPAVHDALAAGQPRFTLIAGVNQETVVGVRREGDDFVFQTSPAGDGTVPLDFAELEDTTTYYIEEEHGSLPNNGEVIKAVIDVMETGATSRLPTDWAPRQRAAPRERSGEQLAPTPFDGRRGKQVSPRELRHLLEEFAAPPRQLREEKAPAVATAVTVSGEPIVVGRRRQQRIDLRLAHGDVSQVDSRALVLGLFRGVDPSGAARAIDAQLDGAIAEFTERRMISANVGEVFIMPANRYRMGAELVVFAGLGTYDDFNDEVLRLVAENIARTLVRTKVDDFATVMLSSATGMAMADVLSNLVEGFLRGLGEGNAASSGGGSGAGGHLRSITLCEFDRQRFEQMHNELLRLTTTPLFDEIEATVEVMELPPPPPAPAVARRGIAGPDPAYLIVREMPAPVPEETDPSVGASFTLRASVLTAGARATVVTDSLEVDAAALNRHLEFIETRAFDYGALDGFGRKLGELVLPGLVRRAMHGTQDRPLVVIHDARASRIPWETLRIDNWAPAANAGLTRKYEAEDMTVAKWLEERRLASQLNVLLIVDPTQDLLGAREEGKRVKELLAQDPTVRLDELWQAQATLGAVRAAFRSGKYDLVHYAGHAFFDPMNRARSGLICHGKQVLSGRELAQLEQLPAVVFFNACESARVRGAELRVRPQRDRQGGQATAQRLETNVGLAEAFLRAGVGSYIGTYWPVGDAPAKAFGEAFYRAIVDGRSVGAALNAGRAAVLALRSVDWADYIHYGSPNFTVKQR